MLIRTCLLYDREAFRRRIEKLLAHQNVLITAAVRKRDIWERVPHEQVDVVLASRLALSDPPQHVIHAIKQLPERPEVIVFSDREDPDERATLLAAGCYAVLYLGLSDDTLTNTLSALLSRRREDWIGRHKGFKEERPEERQGIESFVYISPAMEKLVATARRVASADTSILIEGETGTGKERLARAIHTDGSRRASPFVAVNCAAIPEGLLESELFGHEKGAFTGAIRARRGYFELAHRGTLFLDEVGEMPIHLQAKLLRVLQEQQIQPVGAEKPIDINVRVVAATNRDLATMLEQRQFRPDLFYRLSVVKIRIPPLRERPDDIPILARTFLDHFRRHLKRPVASIDASAMEALCVHNWPGNVRELINVLEHAVLLCNGDRITRADLPYHQGMMTAEAQNIAEAGVISAIPDQLPDSWLLQSWSDLRREVLDQLERRYFSELLARNGGRIGDSSRQAGVDPRFLYQKMREHNLDKKAFRINFHRQLSK